MRFFYSLYRFKRFLCFNFSICRTFFVSSTRT